MDKALAVPAYDKAKRGTWTNWYGNQSCSAFVIDAESEDDIIDAVLFAKKNGLKVRVAGTGHSNVPLIPNQGVVIVTDKLKGVAAHDSENNLVTLWGGTKIHDMGDALWELGLGLTNQGDIDTQSIAGAVSTGTHGTGISLKNLSSMVETLRVVNASADIHTFDGSDEYQMRAARVSLGLLGVVTQVTMKVTKAYHLHEWVGVMPYEAAAEIEDEMNQRFRHFGYFWCSTRASAKWLGLNTEQQTERFDDSAYVRIFDPNPIDVGELAKYEYSRRYDRSYRIYPEVYTPDFHEMEYMIPYEQRAECFQELRATLRDQFNFLTIPAEMRVTAGDENYMSEYFGGVRGAISVSGRMHKEDIDFFRGCDRIFAKYDGRSHWGKIHFLDRERLQQVYPRHADFVAVRRKVDPDNLFLNDYLGPLFG